MLSLPAAEADAGGFRGGETAIDNLVFYAPMRRAIFAALLVLALQSETYAQPRRGDAEAGRLIVTVVDPSGAVIPGATITIAGVDDVTKAEPLAPAKTADKGIATIDGLRQGRYAIQAEFPGFEPATLRDVRVRRGDNKHVVVLAIKRMEESVDVAQDAQAAAADPRGSAFKAALTPEEVEALSDDPADMAQQLQDLAGGNAVIRVDSFLGAPLPPKSQIKAIHVVRDAFAAENHSAESDEIRIITAPGTGPIRVSGSSRFRDGSMSGRSPFTPTKGPERTQTYDGNVGGTIVKNKSSFSLAAGSRQSFDTPTLNVALPGGGRRSEVLNLRRPNDNWFVRGLVDHALTRNHLLRLAYDQYSTDRGNLGIGAYDLSERAYSTESRSYELRVMEVGPIGRRAFANTRLQVQWSNNTSRAALEAPTVRVNDAFTGGGAQTAGGRRSVDFEAASDVDYIRGIHSVRAGFLFEGGQFRSDNTSNYLGTYVFASLAEYEANRPATFTRRIGNPLVDYWFLESGAYLQDDIRVRKGLTLSPGVRYERQTHVHDAGNIGPRFGITWSPAKSGRTTLRGSAGVFYNWVNQGTYEQTLRVDGFRQQELNIVNPAFPSSTPLGPSPSTPLGASDPGSVGTVGAINKYLFGDDVEMARTIRISTGVDRTVTPNVRVSVSYMAVRGGSILRGLNLNPLTGGLRPDPAFANVIALASDARSRTDQVSTTLNVNLLPTRSGNQPRWNWRRTTMRFTYWLSKAENDSDGAFSVSPGGTLATEWGPSPGDRRHRVFASVNSQALRNLNATLSLAGNTGAPYTITTGLDDNGDSIFNDRPVGVGRNTVRADGQWTWNASASYTLRMGVRPSAQERERDRGGDAQGGANRYRLSFNVNVTNLTNHANYTGFSGVMTSPFFERPTAVANPRKVDISVSFGF